MSDKKPPAPPRHLSARARQLWRSIVSTYSLDADEPAALEVLRRACEASDRADQAAAVLTAEGLVVADRYGQLRTHPAAAVEQQSRTALVRCLRELRVLDPREPDRPPAYGRSR